MYGNIERAQVIHMGTERTVFSIYNPAGRKIDSDQNKGIALKNVKVYARQTGLAHKVMRETTVISNELIEVVQP